MKKILKTSILFILVFFGGFFVYSPDANAAITFVARTLQGLGSSGGTTTAIDTTGANFCVLSITSYQQVEAPTPSDSKSNTWTPLTAYTQGSRIRIQIFYAENPTVGTGHTFTASAVVNSFSALGVACFSGMETSSVFQTGTDAGAGTSSSTLQPGSITPGTSPALVITATSGDTLSSPSSIDSSFDAQTLAFNNGVHFASGLAYLIQDPAATVNPTWTYAGSDNATAAIAAFKATPDRYWVGGTATWDGTAGSKWATCSGCAGGAAVPTASDNVFFDAASGANTITLSASSVANNLTFTGFTGTISHPAATTLTISGSLTMVSGMTYTLGNAATSAITFNSTATGKTVTTGGKTLGNVLFSGSGGGWTLQDSYTSSGSLTVNAGTFDSNSQAVSAVSFISSVATARTLTLGSSAITLSGTGSPWNTSTITNLTVTANTATVTLTGTSATFTSGAVDFNGLSLVLNGAGNQGINANSATFANVTRTGTAVETDTAQFNTMTVTGTLTVNGNSATNRVLVTTNQALGVTRTITAAAVSFSNVDFRDITAGGAANWDLAGITGGSGDAGGNSGITFTTADTMYWYTATSGTKTWSTAGNWFLASGGTGGAGRVPLPQDDVVFDANSIGSTSTTIQSDMPRMGKNIDWTGVTNTPMWSNSTSSTLYGSWTMGSGMTVSMPGTLTFEGRGSFTLTSAGKTFNASVTVNMFGGTLTLQDALTVTGSIFQMLNGTLNANNYNVTLTTFSSSNSFTRTVNMGSGTWTVTGTGNAWNVNTATNLTLNANTSTVVVSNTTATAKTFFGGNQTFNNVTFEGDNITVTGSNTFATMAVNNAGLTNGLKLTAGTTQTVSGFTTNGSSGSLAKLVSSSSGSAAALSKSSGEVCVDYMSIKDSAASGGADWYAGANSTSVSGNSGWTFSACPSGDVPRASTTPAVKARGGANVRGGVKFR